jgi:hypothetical protein
MHSSDLTMTLRHAALSAALILSLSPAVAQACSSCGCTLSSDWGSQGLATKPGLSFDLRYDYINQSELRSGSHGVDHDDYPLPNEREIEFDTINRYTTLGIDYGRGDWGLNLQLPFVNRTHSTYPEGETELSYSRSSSIGDARLMFRYQGFSPEKNLGLQLGLKLPTGGHGVRFHAGTETDEPLDRGLQPGTGTTDVLVGAFKFGPISQNLDYFAQALAQAPLNSSDGFRPGAALNLNLGLRYVASERFVPELQLNARNSWKDSGPEADSANSGGSLLNLSPGVSVKIGEHLDAFAFVQVPLLQHVNGLQLAPRYAISAGARYDFR